MISIPLTTGGFAFIDSEDQTLVQGHPWRMSSDGYVVYNTPRDENGKQKIVYMHRLIIGASPENEVDHRGPRNDNRKSQLRNCTRSQNQAAARIRGRNASGFRGVYATKRPIGWKASIRVNGKGIHLGYFSKIEAAAEAYDAAARDFFGDFAQCNLTHAPKGAIIPT